VCSPTAIQKSLAHDHLTPSSTAVHIILAYSGGLTTPLTMPFPSTPAAAARVVLWHLITTQAVAASNPNDAIFYGQLFAPPWLCATSTNTQALVPPATLMSKSRKKPQTRKKWAAVSQPKKGKVSTGPRDKPPLPNVEQAVV
jgi:hypothetical protein